MKRLIGYGTTNSSGVATLTNAPDGSTLSPNGYTGKGVGKIDIQAELHDDSSVVSQPYTVIDAMFYDSGFTGTPNSDWWKSSNNITLTSGDDGLTATGSDYIAPNKNGSSHSSMSDLVDWNDFVCEFTVHSISNTSNTCNLELRDANGNINRVYLSQWSLTDGDVVRVEYSGNVAKFYKNGVQQGSNQTSCSGVVMVRFNLTSNTLKFSNYKLYPI